MRVFLFVSLIFVLISCRHNNTIKSIVDNDSIGSLNKDSIIVDSIYGKGQWSSFKDFKTPIGRYIRFKIINKSRYIMQWGDSINLRMYPDTFYLDGLSNGIPLFIEENKDYIVMKSGCGSPCWVGYFLPLNNITEPFAAHEYLGYDLNDNLVSFVKDSNVISVYNIKSKQIENHVINGCTSAFIGYCIDSLSIKKKVLKYKWYPDTYMNSDKGRFRIEKIKI